MKQPYTQQWTGNMQYGIGSFLFELGYVGSASTHLVAFMNPNQPLLASPSSPVNGITTNTIANRALRVPILGWLPSGIRELQSVLNANYNSLQFSLKRRFSNGLSFMAAYTWSHAIDNNNAGSGGRNQPLGGYTGDYYNRGAMRGNASFDRTHRVVASYSYDLPTFRFSENRVVRAMLSNWAVSGVTTIQSGLPFSITDTTSGTIYGISGFAQFAPGMGPDDARKSGSAQSRLGSYFNPAAFGAPPALGDGTGFGNVGRNILRGPGNVNFDSAVSRIFPVGGLSDTGKLELRTEFFNLFNHSQFANPAGNRAAAATYGVISNTVVSPRIIQFALKYAF